MLATAFVLCSLTARPVVLKIDLFLEWDIILNANSF